LWYSLWQGFNRYVTFIACFLVIYCNGYMLQHCYKLGLCTTHYEQNKHYCCKVYSVNLDPKLNLLLGIGWLMEIIGCFLA
jgi:hypothetical protein